MIHLRVWQAENLPSLQAVKGLQYQLSGQSVFLIDQVDNLHSDYDHRCVQMTAINLGLRGLFGFAVWQNTLTLEVHRVYKIGFNLAGGVIREVPVEQSPFDYRQNTPTIRENGDPLQQRDLF